MFSSGIIAAGHGSRFKDKGFTYPKPLLKVAGTELLGRAITELKKAGVKHIRIIFRNSICDKCTSYLKKSFPEICFQIICKDTSSSAESFLTILNAANHDERMIITTVDSIFTPGKLRDFIEQAQKMPSDGVILGVTTYIDDEKPLYVKLSREGDSKITAIGGNDGDAVTCGVYLLPARITKKAKDKKYSALRAFLSDLFLQGIEFRAIDMGKVIDVDRPEDLIQAEEFLRSNAIRD